MRFASVCSGILGAELAWEPLGWEPAWCAEIDPFASRLIAHRRPGLENHGDFTKIGPDAGPIDLLGGGTPCQAFSMSGDRRGLDDPRGELSLEFASLARRIGARWVVWENVPGVLSSCQGRDFGVFLGALVECGYSVAYRILDACFFGLAQRRRRVWVVGYLGDWRPPCAVLFERPSLQGNNRKIGTTGTPFVSSTGGRTDGSEPELSRTLLAIGKSTRAEEETYVSHTLGASRSVDDGAGAFIAFDAAQITSPDNRSNPRPGGPSPALAATNRVHVARAVRARHDSGGDPSRDTWVSERAGVRKLTPLEYERLQGFRDGWTAIPKASDSARYRALGNAWPVPVARWIGERIDQVDRILRGAP